MSKDLFPADVSKRICNHMNLDHKDSLITYAKHYGGISNPIHVELVDITKNAMHLEVDEESVEILFDHKLKDSSDAHKTLVSMIKSLSD